MIVVTGAAGFIGSIVLAELNKKGNNDLILVDDFSKQNKERNYIDAKYNELIDRDYYFDWFENNHDNVEFVIHLGARTDTTEFDWSVFEKLNVSFTQKMFGLCAEYNIPLKVHFSLHTPIDSVRKELIPAANMNIEDCIDSLDSKIPLQPIVDCEICEFPEDA